MVEGKSDGQHHDHAGDAELGPGHIQQPGAGAMGQAIGDDQGRRRPRHNDDDDAGGEVSEIEQVDMTRHSFSR
jgi:hypothetical protein